MAVKNAKAKTASKGTSAASAKTSKRRPAEEEEIEEELGFGEEGDETEEEDVEVGTNNGSVTGGADYWKGVFENLGQGNSNFIFPKGGKTNVRLIRKSDAPFYVEVPSFYKGRERTKYLIMAWNPAAKDESTGEKIYEVRGLIIPKTAFKAIAAHLAEGYEFFHPLQGHGITLVRSGEGRDTSYTVIPSAKPVPLPQQLKPALAKTSFKTLVAEYKKMKSSRPEGESANGTEEAEDESDW